MQKQEATNGLFGVFFQFFNDLLQLQPQRVLRVKESTQIAN
jgi:hypothetical protein